MAIKTLLRLAVGARLSADKLPPPLIHSGKSKLFQNFTALRDQRLNGRIIARFARSSASKGTRASTSFLSPLRDPATMRHFMARSQNQTQAQP
ncbi:hypothetical protein RAAC3_TM7C00001G0234 [Candidatus Saccharibacteria bacterium RAAC3_TM7_1]|nr:hypothetical protein RAAC3_TM7C00001G0234 [Candidatus Saccharibacteria bacterium RAAC3_TM7_1]